MWPTYIFSSPCIPYPLGFLDFYENHFFVSFYTCMSIFLFSRRQVPKGRDSLSVFPEQCFKHRCSEIIHWMKEPLANMWGIWDRSWKDVIGTEEQKFAKNKVELFHWEEPFNCICWARVSCMWNCLQLLCRQRWPWIPNPPASSSQMPREQLQLYFLSSVLSLSILWWRGKWREHSGIYRSIRIICYANLPAWILFQSFQQNYKFK